MTAMREIYRAERLPVFQNRMFRSEASARNCARGDVVLVQSMESGLIFNRAFQPELMHYDADYQNEQGHSGAFKLHLDAMAKIVSRHFAGMSLIEVGCGKGLFLEQLSEIGFDVTGLDPTYEGSNPRIVKEYFTSASGIRAQGIVLRHVLEHVQDPMRFLVELLESNGGSGRIYIEVPCMDWIAQHRAWFDIFYEHVNYFRLSDFERMFSSVIEAGHCFDGQYLYVVADLASLRQPRYRPGDEFALPRDFMSAIGECRSRVLASGRAAAHAIWGGASKGVIFALFMEREGAPIDTVIDINPAKQGKFLAATGLRVSSPEEGQQRLQPGADLFVMNSNYLREIQMLTAHRYNYLLVEHRGQHERIQA